MTESSEVKLQFQQDFNKWILEMLRILCFTMQLLLEDSNCQTTSKL